jgi:arylsulfatase A-like enzyme
MAFDLGSAGATTALPHIVFMMTDDLGWNSAWKNDEQITPTLDALAATGVELTSHYSYKYCAPSRASFLTGRYPFHHAATRCNLIPSTIPEGIDLGYTMLPKVLSLAGYTSHHIGKWHQGFHTRDYTPVGRGFNTSWGFLQGGEDHYTHICGAAGTVCDIPGFPAKQAGAWDLWTQNLTHFPGAPLFGLNGTAAGASDDSTYSGYLFTERAVELIDEHENGPMFLYLALHNTHAPVEAPQRFINLYEGSDFGNDTKKKAFSAMVSAVDESVFNVTEALKRNGFWESTLFVWTTDVSVCLCSSRVD